MHSRRTRKRVHGTALPVADYLWKRLAVLPLALKDQVRVTLAANDRAARTGTHHHAVRALEELAELARMANHWRDAVVFVARDEYAAHFRRRSLNDLRDAFETAEAMTKRQRAEVARISDNVACLELALDLLNRLIAALARGETDGSRI